jgi:RNA polymerase sigma-70 factor, ECF subfamily
MARPLEGHAILLEYFTGDGQSRERCFRRIWREYYPRLLVFVRAQGGPAAAEAEDTVQEIMEKIFRAMGTYDPAWRFSTWTYTVARNTCRDRARRRRCRPTVWSLSDLPAGAEPFHARSPEQELMAAQAVELVRAFFRREQPENRQIAFLRFAERMRCAEIAAVMEMPVGTVKFRIHEMRRRLSSCLEAENG